MRVKQLVVSVLSLFILASSVYALFHAGFFRVHDYTHAARISELLRAAQDGHFPVRWTPNFSFGWGMPLFEFYAPLPYYTGALLYWLGLNIILTIKALYLICTVGTFVGAYLLGKSLFGRAGGVLTATALTLAPYRAVNLFVRGSLSEAWAIMAMPWVLWGVIRLIRGERRAWVTVLLSSIVLMLSHNITTMFYFPFVALFALVYAVLHYRQEVLHKALRPLIALAGTMVLAMGGALFYLLPALTEKDFTRVQAIFEGYFYYAIHFLYIRQFFIPNWGYGGSVGGPQDDMSFFLGYGQLMAVGLALGVGAWWTWRRLQSKGSRAWPMVMVKLGALTTFGAFSAIALFMSLFKSQFVWQALPVLEVAQFPWRWLSVGSFFLALMGGAVVWFIPWRIVRWGVVAGLCVVIVAGNASFFQPQSYLNNPDDFYYTDPSRIRSQMSAILNDYIPKQVPDNPPVVDQAIWSVNGVRMTSDRLEEKDTQITPRVNRVQEKLWDMRFANPAVVEFGTADFPGWQITLDGNPVATERGELGNLKTAVPSGEHQVGIQLLATPVRQMSDAVSVISWVVILVLLFIWVTPDVITKRYSHEKVA